MGRTQQPDTSQEAAVEQRVLEALVLILSGDSDLREGHALVLATAGAIELLLPAVISGALREAVSTDIAEMVLRDYPRDTGGSSALSEATRENIAYRALYGVSAIKRAVSALIGGQGQEESGISERLEKWASAEASYFEAHLSAASRREKGAAVIDAMVDLHGPVLGWHDTGRAHTHRPEHLRASGKNFDVRNGPPIETNGAWPGQAPGCDCVVVPPRQGAEILLSRRL